jgi:anti-sigma B factor antagonist
VALRFWDRFTEVRSAATYLPKNEERAHVEETFGVTEELASGHRVVSVTGEVDVATAPTLRAHLEDAVDRSEGVLAVDLLAVTFIDSTALGVLIGALKQSDARGVTMRVVMAEPRILKVFEITGLIDVFAIYPTLEEALQA